jgi:hypothetical protein
MLPDAITSPEWRESLFLVAIYMPRTMTAVNVASLLT